MNTLIEPTEETTDRGDHFHIDSDNAANWLLRKLANIEAEKARIQAQAAEMVKQLEDDADNLRRLYEAELVNYARQRLAETSRGRRTLTLLQGSVSFRIVPGSVRVADPFRALDHCRTVAPELIHHRETIKTTEYQRLAAKHLAETGEVLPGCETTTAHETHRLTFGR